MTMKNVFLAQHTLAVSAWRTAMLIWLLLVAAFIPSAVAQEIELKLVVSGMTNPVAITHAGDGSGRLFITLKGGQIIVYDGTMILSQPFLDIANLVSTSGERGLLSVAFHPNFISNGLFFVDYTDISGNTIIARYTVSKDPNAADPNSAVVLLSIPQPFENHNGGQLQFGPDGYLYIGMGDGGSGGDPSDNAQNPATLLGKMLRIDVDAGVLYGVPPDNPFVGNPQTPEIWALGLRNPWRFSFDRLTGDLFIADVGQSNWEEVNFQPSDSGGGENYGWRLMEGSHCFNPAVNCTNGSLVLPIVEYDHAFGDCSITGGYRYRGTQHPGLQGVYFYGDFCTGRIWGASQNASDNWVTDELIDTALSISAFGEDEDGELYVANFSATDGAVYRIVESMPVSNVSGGGGSGSGGCFIKTSNNP